MATTSFGNMPPVFRRQMPYMINDRVCYRRFKWSLNIWIYTILLLSLLSCILAIPSDVVVTSDASQYTKEGDSIQLTCLITVTSTETLNYVRWIRSGMTFTEFDNLVIPDPLDRLSVTSTIQGTFRAYSLHIAGVQLSDSGLYSCHIGFTDSSGSPSEISRSLSVSVVYYTPPSTSPQCETEVNVDNVSLGDLVRLTCASQKGNPIVNVTWTRSTPSGHMEDIPLTQVNHFTDLTLLVYSFFVNQEHNGSVMTCNIRSSEFPGFQRNCTIGPFVVTDLPTTAITTSQKIPPTTIPYVYTTDPMSTARITKTVTPQESSPSASALTINTSTVYENFTTSSKSPSSQHLTSTMTPTNTTSSPVMTSILSNSTTVLTSPSPSTPWMFSAFIMILVISAAGVIMLLLICNVAMLTRVFIGSNSRQRVIRRTIRVRSISRHRDLDGYLGSDNQSEA